MIKLWSNVAKIADLYYLFSGTFLNWSNNIFIALLSSIWYIGILNECKYNVVFSLKATHCHCCSHCLNLKHLSHWKLVLSFPGSSEILFDYKLKFSVFFILYLNSIWSSMLFCCTSTIGKLMQWRHSHSSEQVWLLFQQPYALPSTLQHVISWFAHWSISTMLCVKGGFEILEVQNKKCYSNLAQQEWKKTDVPMMNYEQMKYFRMAPPARWKCVSAENKIVWEWFDFRSFGWSTDK